MTGIGIGVGIGLGRGSITAAQRLSAARAAVLSDAPECIYYADVGLTPASPSVGDNVTAWADQSGNSANLTFVSEREPHYGLDGTIPYLELSAALDVVANTATAATTGARVYRWVEDSTASGDFGILFWRANEVICTHGAGFNADGNQVIVAVGGSYVAVGAMQDGKHCYELRLDPTAQTATLLIDGAALSPVSLGAFSTPGSDIRIGFSSTGFGATGHLYGWCLQDGAGTAAQTSRWNYMAHLAWY